MNAATRKRRYPSIERALRELIRCDSNVYGLEALRRRKNGRWSPALDAELADARTALDVALEAYLNLRWPGRKERINELHSHRH